MQSTEVIFPLDARPIGVFDSGLGGLTAVRELRRTLPAERIIYFGDTSRVPYGTRSGETILKYARQDLRFLRRFDLKAVLIACGTVSTTSLEPLRAENDIPVLGVVEPSVRRALELTRTGRVGLVATPSSVRSGAYQRLFKALDPAAEVVARACPLLVPLVENGRFRPGDLVAETLVREYLEPVKAAGVDALVLGCTHYPLLAEIIGAFMGPDTALVDSGAAAAAALRRQLEETDALAPAGDGQISYYSSDRAEDFRRLAGLFLGEELTQGVEQIDIDRY